MALSKKDVEHVARLARLGLSDEEKERYTQQLGQILTYIEKMSALDTQNVAPTTHVLPLSNVWRDDKVEPSTPASLGSPEEIVANAPEHEAQLFKVKKIIE